MLRASPRGETSNTATVAVTTHEVSLLIKTKKNIFYISNGTSRVNTVTVAVFDVSLHGLYRNVTYRSSFIAGQSCSLLRYWWNFSEAWFIYLTFWYRDWRLLECIDTFYADL
jgi:hypothetical protein